MGDEEGVDLGLRLKVARVQCKMRQKDLAATVGISPRTLSRYENEGFPLRLMQGETLRKLARALGVTMEYLLGTQEPTTIPGA